MLSPKSFPAIASENSGGCQNHDREHDFISITCMKIEQSFSLLPESGLFISVGTANDTHFPDYFVGFFLFGLVFGLFFVFLVFFFPISLVLFFY